MFYLKHEGIKLCIESDNVYNACPVCGREVCVDLAEVLGDGKSDLYGTAICCQDCAERFVKEAESDGK